MTDRWGKTIKDKDGRNIDTREYLFSRPSKDPIIIQDHSAGHAFGQSGIGDQGPHFNVRPAAPAEQRRNGHIDGTKDHYQFTVKKL